MELNQELFCHLFDEAGKENSTHRHIFHCDAPDSVFLHLLQHLQKNDHNILQLLACRNNELFLQHFKANLRKVVVSQLHLFEARKSDRLPEDFWIDHITATFVQTLRWWAEGGMKESPETIAEYFYLAV
jgi:hypothetical protein